MSRCVHDIIHLSKPFYCWHHSDKVFILSHEEWIKENIPSLRPYFPQVDALPFLPLPRSSELSGNFVQALIKACYSRESNSRTYLFRVDDEFVEEMIIPNNGYEFSGLQMTKIPINDFVK
jgi:hypothetical protein